MRMWATCRASNVFVRGEVMDPAPKFVRSVIIVEKTKLRVLAYHEGAELTWVVYMPMPAVRVHSVETKIAAAVLRSPAGAKRRIEVGISSWGRAYIVSLLSLRPPRFNDTWFYHIHALFLTRTAKVLLKA